jgi:hypothetical protein
VLGVESDSILRPLKGRLEGGVNGPRAGLRLSPASLNHRGYEYDRGRRHVLAVWSRTDG